MRILLLSIISHLFIWGAVLASPTEWGSKGGHHVEWGVYEMLTRRYSWEDRLDQAEKDFGIRPQFVLFFRDLNTGRGFPAERVENAHAREMTPVISLEISRWGRGNDTGYLKEVTEGKFDKFFRQWAKDAKACGLAVILRFGFEMNGDWFPWGNQPESFINAWRRVYNIFKELECNNIQWMFSPNVLWAKRTAKKDLYNYYPGDAYVDVIGLDGYNFGDHYDKWHKWQTYEEVFESSIRACMKFNKPLYISEIGCADDLRKSAWIKDFLGKISKDERIKGFIYFNHFNPRKQEPNWRLDSDEDSLRIFREWAEVNATRILDMGE
ncbi:MAG: glycosyl hydrolase [Verrucomicrobia bacterium]|nr:glycosyl hydrolase [Verrucomicrobiota bacterium]